MPNVLKNGPIKTLTKEQVLSLTATGWLITPPALKDSEGERAEVLRLIAEIEINTARLNSIITTSNKGE
jgi:hypothetical protein